MFRLEEIADELRDAVATLDAPTHSSRDAARLTKVAAEGERLFAAAKVLLARRAVDGNGWRNGNDAIVPEQWFAGCLGLLGVRSTRALKTGERLAGSARHRAEAARRISLAARRRRSYRRRRRRPQRGSATFCASPTRARCAGCVQVKERVVTAAMDETEARRRAHRDRNLRTWTRGLSTHGSFQGPTEEVAVLLAAIEPLKRQAFTAARKADEHDTPDAYRYDALIELGRRAMHVADTPITDAVPVTRLRVGLGRLLDHETIPGEEVCEIPGVGPVPVAHARKVLPHGLWSS